MKNREPYDLRWIIRVFNLCQIAHNIYMITYSFLEPNYTSFLITFGCLAVTPQQNATFMHNVYRGYWHYLVNKVFDLCDTVFFVLRKKQRQVTFLHVHHHASMVLIMYILGNYFPGKESAFAGLINANIHVIMYTYYTMASFGDMFQGHLKYKKYLTILQIVQFLLILSYNTAAHFMSCGYNLVVAKLIMFESIINLVLFINFYRKTYGKDRLAKMTKMMICTSLQMKEGMMDSHTGKVMDENQNLIEENVENKKEM